MPRGQRPHSVNSAFGSCFQAKISRDEQVNMSDEQDHAHLTPGGGGALLKERATPPPRMCTNCWGSEAPLQRMCTNCWGCPRTEARGPTPKDVYKLLGVRSPTPKDVYTLLGHSGGNFGVLGGLDGQFHEKTGTTTPYEPRNQGARHAASPPPVPLLLCYLYALATSHDVSRKIPVTRIPSDAWVVPESRVGST